MRGLINNPVECFKCHLERAYTTEKPCSICLMHAAPHPRRKHIWTPELDKKLQALYQEAKTKSGLSEGITDFERRTGFPRHVIRMRAQRHGFTTDLRKYKHWTEEEVAFVREHAGEMAISTMAKKIRRTYHAVKTKINLMGT